MMMPGNNGGIHPPQGAENAQEDCGSDADWQNEWTQDIDGVEEWAYSNDFDPTKKDCFKIIVWNARSFFKKRDEIEEVVKETDILIV